MRHMQRILSKDLMIRLLLKPTCLGLDLSCKVRLSLAACWEEVHASFQRRFWVSARLYYGFSEMGLVFE